MYVTVRSFRMRNVDEAARRTAKGLVPMLQQAPGFRGYHVFKTADGRGGSVSLFDSREQAEAAHQNAMGWIRENLMDLYEGTPDVILGEVVQSVTA